MDKSFVLAFLTLVFIACFLLLQGLSSPASGDARARRVLRKRLEQIREEAEVNVKSLLRENYLKGLSPLERRLEELPFMDRLSGLSEQAGRAGPAYRVVLSSAMFALIGGTVCAALLHNPILGLIAAGAGLAFPFARLVMQRQRRMEKIEEQLPDAIDMIKRALRAGHTFNSAIQLVAQDMEQPIAHEFELTFNDLNYGNDVRRAMLGLLNRVPSVTVMALVTSVLVQRDTGGNLAEILDQISRVVRDRFRFGRRLRTLSAEGRMSAWVLALIPVALVGILSITSPNYLPVLLENPTGHKLLYTAGTLGVLGILWIRKVIRIEV